MATMRNNTLVTSFIQNNWHRETSSLQITTQKHTFFATDRSKFG